MANWFTADRIVGLVLLVASVFFMFQALQLEHVIPPAFRKTPMRLDTMPKIIGVIAIAASLLTIFMPSTLTRESEDTKVKDANEKLKDLSFANIGNYAVGQLAAMISLMCVYALVLRPLGFIPSTALFLFLGSFLLGERRWVGLILTSLIAPISIWLLVTYVLERKIPALPQFLLG